MVRLIRLVFPHDVLPDSAYERTADSLLLLSTQSNRMMLAVSRGLDSLDDLDTLEHLDRLDHQNTLTHQNTLNARSERAGDFLALPADAATRALHRIEHTNFFTFVRGNAVLTLYNLPEVWQALGYEGASVAKGGYLTRGFDDLDWLPEVRVEEYQGDLSRVSVGPLAHPVGPGAVKTEPAGAADAAGRADAEASTDDEVTL